jgi:CheY-like chemotaxis protein
MNNASATLEPVSSRQLLARAGLPHDITISTRLREQFRLPVDEHCPEWFDLMWMVRCTLNDCLPSRSMATARGHARLVEFFSIQAGASEPAERCIAVVCSPTNTVHVCLPEELAVIPPLVLIVEDDEHVGELAGELIRRLGAEVVLARDGEEGWQLAKAHRPGFVITDVDMPRLNGLNLCRQLKAHAELRSIPVLIWSGDPSHETAALNLGAVGFISKPFNFSELTRRLRQLLNGLLLGSRQKPDG